MSRRHRGPPTQILAELTAIRLIATLRIFRAEAADQWRDAVTAV